MTHLVDLSGWPLVRAAQNGRMTVAEAEELNASMLSALERARAEGRRFAIVVDQSDRRAPHKGALEIVHEFWAERASEIAEWCCAYATVVASRELTELVVNPGPGGLLVLGALDEETAVEWARDRLEGAAAA